MLAIRNLAQAVGITLLHERSKRGPAMRDLKVLSDAAVVLDGTRIAWVGPDREVPALPIETTLDASGRSLLPGLVDSHTHLIFAGERIDEFEQRLLGRSYQEISTAGGGILATVRRVRSSSREELKNLARPRLRQLLRFGVTTVEVKSGYGLTLTDELKCLEAIAELNTEGPLELVPTFLGAHDIPQEYQNDREGYVQLLCQEMLPEVVRRRLATFCDVFCERGVFSVAESERILTRASDLGLHLKLHADELSDLGGAGLASRLRAASADHLLCISDAGMEALAQSETIATLLPGTAFFLGLAYAPARRLIERGAAVALASDCNPGTCPTENLPLIGALACTQMKMLPAEVVNALTLNAAAALALSDRLGSLAVGKQADLVLFDVADYRRIFYEFGVNHVWRVFKRGQLVHAA